MSKKITLFILFVIAALWCAYGCVMRPERPQMENIIIPGGSVVPTLGVGFDVTYDPSLDDVIPGYKLLNVVYINNSMDIVQMNSAGDKWWLEDRRGKKIKAITDLRDKDPDAWSKLPKKLKVLMEYPLIVPIGSTESIDLLFKKDVNLGEFKSVIFRSANANKQYKILPREN